MVDCLPLAPHWTCRPGRSTKRTGSSSNANQCTSFSLFIKRVFSPGGHISIRSFFARACVSLLEFTTWGWKMENKIGDASGPHVPRGSSVGGCDLWCVSNRRVMSFETIAFCSGISQGPCSLFPQGPLKLRRWVRSLKSGLKCTRKLSLLNYSLWISKSLHRTVCPYRVNS